MNKISKNSISLAGEFAVLSKLSILGFDSSLTLGNTKGVDILLSIPDSDKMYKLEVKSKLRSVNPSQSELFGRHYAWVMNKKHETIIDSKLFYCFVVLDDKENQQKFFVIPSKIVAKYVKEQHELWAKTHPETKTTEMRQFRIGCDRTQKSYRLFTPLASKYEDNWSFKK